MWVSSVIPLSFTYSSKMPTTTFGMTSTSNHSFRYMKINVNWWFLGSEQGPSPDTYLKTTLMMCWMSKCLHGVNVYRTRKKPDRTSRFETHVFLTLISPATSISFIRYRIATENARIIKLPGGAHSSEVYMNVEFVLSHLSGITYEFNLYVKCS